jgi:histone H3/H4
MALQALPTSADRYARSQRREIKAAVAAVRRLWRRMTPEFDLSYSSIEAQVLRVLAEAQARIAREAVEYIPAVLEETGQTVGAAAQVTTAPLIGYAGDGRPVASLMYGAVTRAKSAVGEGATALQALNGSGKWLSAAAGTLLSDTGRASETLATTVRPVGGYVRMLNPPSCSRCAILAGRYYRWNAGFLRHPGCDCRHIPASESLAGDLTVNPDAYFDSLTETQQDKVFTKSGAQAVRDGADIGQVVNARRGMSYAGARITAEERRALVGGDRARLRTTNVYGQDVYITTEGTTTRGLAGVRLGARETGTKNGRYRRAQTPRLMPESIYQLAENREDAVRLLRRFGYIL